MCVVGDMNTPHACDVRCHRRVCGACSSQLVTSIMLLLYLPLMKSAFSLWGCTQDEDGSPVWVGDDNIVCDSGEYWTITVLGGIVAVMCAILPGVLMVVLYQLERSGNLHASSEGVALAPAYDGYRPGRGMFEGCVLAMKVCTLVCFVFAEREDSEEGVQWWSVGDAAFANMVIIGLYMLAVTVLMPWRDHEVHILCWLVPNAHNITGVVSAWATAGAAAASWLRSGYDEPAPLWLVWYQSGCGALIGMVVAVQTLIVVQGSAHSIRYSRSTEARAASRSLKARQAQRTSLFIMGASSSRLKIGRSAEPDGTELVSLNPLASREVVDVIADAMPRATKETLESQADEEALMLVPNNSVLCAEAANRRTKAQRTYSTKSSVRGMVRVRAVAVVVVVSVVVSVVVHGVLLVPGCCACVLCCNIQRRAYIMSGVVHSRVCNAALSVALPVLFCDVMVADATRFPGVRH